MGGWKAGGKPPENEIIGGIYGKIIAGPIFWPTC